MDLVIKGMVAALVVVIVSVLSRTQYVFLSGLVALVPVNMLFAHYITYNTGGPPDLKNVLIFGLVSLVPLALYLLVMLFTVDRLGFGRAIGCSIAGWLLSSGLLVIIWSWRAPKF